MKICFVSTSFIRHARDGYARFVYEQAKSLLRIGRNYEIIVIAPHAPGFARSEIIDGLKIYRFCYFVPIALQRLAYQNEGLFNTLKSSPGAAFQFPGFVLSMSIALWRQSRGASVIHAQWLPTAAIAVLVGFLRGIPVCVSVRGADLNSLRNSWLGMRIGRWILNRVDAVCTVSEEFHEILSRLNTRPPIYTLFNGVDTDVFRQRDKNECRTLLNIPKQCRLILYVGALIARKGISTLLKAFAQIREKLSSEWCVYIAGEGHLISALESEASELSIRDQVRFLGRVARNDVALWMSASECLVLPSESEGRPNVVIEAMAAGIPVVASAVNGTVEIICSGHNGLLFPPGDYTALGDQLLELIGKPEMGRQFVSNGRATLEAQHLSWESHGHQLDKIYERLVGH